MTIDRGSHELTNTLKDLVICGDAIVTLRSTVKGDVDVIDAATLKQYGHVTGDVRVNTAGRVDIHGVVDGAVEVTAGDVRIIGTVGGVTGEHAGAVKLCSGSVVAGQRQY